MRKLVRYYSEKCVPCKQMLPIFDKVATKYQDSLDVVSIDALKTDVTAANIRGVPTLILLDATGTEVKRHIGTLTESQLEAFLAE